MNNPEFIEREAESRALVLAPIGRMEVFQAVRAQGEPLELPDLFFVIHVQDDGTGERTLGTAGNLAAALMLCSIKVAEQLAERAQAKPAPAEDPALARMFAAMDTSKVH